MSAAKITVETLADAARGHRLLVTVNEGTDGTTRHKVTLSDDVLARLGQGRDAAAFTEACFRFLLEREPKESILTSFDVEVISKYFPDFEDEIRSYL